MTGRRRRLLTWKWLVLAVVLIGFAMVESVGRSIEEPKFAVVLHQGAFEIRDYQPVVAAEVTVTGDQTAAASKGFRLLAGYIFGGNTRRQSIAMTAPVAQQRTGETIAMTAPVTQTASNGAWVVRFTMPAGMSLASLPTPDDARVRLREIGPTRFAVVRFSGFATPSNVAAYSARLADFITTRGLHPIGPTAIAQYNPPWTLWFLRRNEVMIPLAP